MIKPRLRFNTLPTQPQSDRIQNQTLFNCWVQALTFSGNEQGPCQASRSIPDLIWATGGCGST